MPEAAESRETRRPTVEASSETRVSSKHPDYNEDASLGDVSRLQRELAKMPPLSTENAALDTNVMKTAMEAEKNGAESLKQKRIFGVLDGVSGDKNGGGMFASRLASAELANNLSDLLDSADAETSRKALAEAVQKAHEAVLEHKQDRPDLKSMSSTVDVARVIENPDGTFDVPYAHAGDSRIYVYSAEDGTLSQETTDDIAANLMVEKGLITAAERELILGTDDPSTLPKDKPKLQAMFKARYALSSAVGSTEAFKVSSGVIKGLKKGDKVLMFSDGVHDNMKEDRMLAIIEAGGGMKEIAEEAAKFAASGAEGSKPDDVTGNVIELGGRDEDSADQKRAFSGTQLKAVKVEDTERQKAADAAEIARIKKELDAAADVTGDAMAIDEAVELSDADVQDDADDEEPVTLRRPEVKKKGLLDRLFGKKE